MIVLVNSNPFLLILCPLHILVIDEDFLTLSYDYPLTYSSPVAGLSFDQQLLKTDTNTSYLV